MGFLRELWTLYPGGSPTRGGTVKLWAQRRAQSPLASVGEVFGGALPIETLTLRMRYRTDVARASGLRDPGGRFWLVNEVLSVGGRFLDVGLSRYGPLSFPATGAPDGAVRVEPLGTDEADGYQWMNDSISGANRLYVPGGGALEVAVFSGSFIGSPRYIITVGSSDPAWAWAFAISAGRFTSPSDPSSTRRALAEFTGYEFVAYVAPPDNG